ncbi:PREDICTED: UDP-glucuronosyltransferase 2A1-like isoform X5 [Nanorana parkeri]|uniref:UDP-glucuronosyltransferase 2A1-like isoform X5 n=1 Tax=Nanorana parkeri TaxID=125878 RepID=UPI0008540047|nr:PREDICTED: UDP-glucuronosyltransferase 2A1-like isoform X5 [Nanorana parkeri]
MLCASVLLLLHVSFFSTAYSGKILAWPTDGSHFMNLNTILEKLAHKGHEVTVLVNSANLIMDTHKTSALKFEVFPVAFSRHRNEELLEEFLRIWIYDLANMSYWEFFTQMKKSIADSKEVGRLVCDGIIKNKEMLKKLKEEKFDILVADPLAPCGRPTTFCETMGKAEIWLIRTYWDFEYPRPILPNFEYVGGLHCKPAKPLSEEMEKVVQSSGEHGIVVFSLGSMVKNLTEDRNNVIAAALSQLPQKVIWRYSGKKPDTLGENTVIYDWIPQNDLLGHPKTKAFITHGGTNGIYEAIYHGIPMVGIPLFADQPDNMIHMKTKGMAVIVDINKMKSQDLVDAVNTVINNPTYKENALRISRIHHDQPMKPLDRAVFWIEFVMRHKGAKHLRPASHDLTWYQYHCLDVIGVLLVCLFAILYINVKIFLFFCRKCRPIKKKQKKH